MKKNGIRTGLIKVNLSHGVWKAPAERIRMLGPERKHRLSSSREDHYFVHELGHHVHMHLGAVNTNPLTSQQREPAKVVSAYASKGAIGEFLAETFAALVAKRPLPPEVIALYDSFGGRRQLS